MEGFVVRKEERVATAFRVWDVSCWPRWLSGFVAQVQTLVRSVVPVATWRNFAQMALIWIRFIKHDQKKTLFDSVCELSCLCDCRGPWMLTDGRNWMGDTRWIPMLMTMVRTNQTPMVAGDLLLSRVKNGAWALGLGLVWAHMFLI